LQVIGFTNVFYKHINDVKITALMVDTVVQLLSQHTQCSALYKIQLGDDQK